MGQLLLGSPTIQFYLLVVGAGLIFALWPDGSGPRGKRAGSRAQSRGDPSGPREGGGQSCPAPRPSPGQAAAACLPFGSLRRPTPRNTSPGLGSRSAGSGSREETVSCLQSFWTGWRLWGSC